MHGLMFILFELLFASVTKQQQLYEYLYKLGWHLYAIKLSIYVLLA